MSDIYDVIVVGAGVEGSSTAYHLAKSGKRTLLLEQVGKHLQFNTCSVICNLPLSVTTTYGVLYTPWHCKKGDHQPKQKFRYF